MNSKVSDSLDGAISGGLEVFDRALLERAAGIHPQETGRVVFVSAGIARVKGLPGAQLEELVEFPGNVVGMVFDIDADQLGIVVLVNPELLRVGAEVRRTGRVLDVPVGDGLIGRVVSPLGRPLDGRGPVSSIERRPIERPAVPIMDRAAVSSPLQTGIKAVDALVPIGKGQRELILGDRQTGKTTIAVDTMLSQKDTGVICIYCAIGQRSSSTAQLVDELRQRGAMDYCVVMVAGADEPAGLQFACPYAAMTVAEEFMADGRDVLVVFDDLTKHARAYRELALLLRRPPGREAFPGDIFYVHSRLLERSTHLRDELGGGSVTALPIIETEAQNVSGYVPTNLISITDGQVYLSPTLFQRGQLPAVDVGRSVSRVGGRAQLPAYRAIAGALRMSYAQFEELESFARFATRLDEDTRRRLEHGRRIREVLKQPQYRPVPVSEQIAVLLVAVEGLLDGSPLEDIADTEQAIRRAISTQLPEACRRIEDGKKLADADRQAIMEVARRIMGSGEAQPHGDA